LNEEYEIVCSKNKVARSFTTKLGYEARIKEEIENEKAQWWKNIWKLRCLLKHIFLTSYLQ
jgi:hypothetical protein